MFLSHSLSLLNFLHLNSSFPSVSSNYRTALFFLLILKQFFHIGTWVYLHALGTYLHSLSYISLILACIVSIPIYMNCHVYTKPMSTYLHLSYLFVAIYHHSTKIFLLLIVHFHTHVNVFLFLSVLSVLPTYLA